MPHFVYILYSKQLDRYYVGETADLNQRLQQHNSGYYDDAYTKTANDWALFHSIPCGNRSTARMIEAHIKKMKSKKYLYNLKKHPGIRQKLLERYSRGS